MLMGMPALHQVQTLAVCFIEYVMLPSHGGPKNRQLFELEDMRSLCDCDVRWTMLARWCWPQATAADNMPHYTRLDDRGFSDGPEIDVSAACRSLTGAPLQFFGTHCGSAIGGW